MYLASSGQRYSVTIQRWKVVSEETKLSPHHHVISVNQAVIDAVVDNDFNLITELWLVTQSPLEPV